MIKAGLLCSMQEWHWERQFPGRVPVWNDVHFQFDGDFSACDVIFVFDGIRAELSGQVKAKRSVFVATEPASVKTYNPLFLDQFDVVLTTDPATRHRNVRFTEVGLNWHVGAWDSEGKLLVNPMGVDEFQGYNPVKTKLLSVVSSNKVFTKGHAERLEFVRKLKAHFGDEIDVFGRGIRGFGDKLEVLRDYKYHIAIENSRYDHYWTEKLSDPLLTLTYPIYYGCHNIDKYFKNKCLSVIDIKNPDQSIEIIRSIIEADIYEKRLADLQDARNLILTDRNLFSFASRIAHELCASGEVVSDDLGVPLLAEVPLPKRKRTFVQRMRRSLDKRLHPDKLYYD